MKLKLVAHKIRSHAPSVKRHPTKNSKFLLLFFGIGVVFFALAIVLYMFQNKIPRIEMPSNAIVRPDSAKRDEINFTKAFKEQGLVFESIAYATESPTLIVKLPEGAYAYLNSSEDPKPAIKILKSILSRISIEQKNKKLKYIDLRFEKAIVKF